MKQLFLMVGFAIAQGQSFAGFEKIAFKNGLDLDACNARVLAQTFVPRAATKDVTSKITSQKVTATHVYTLSKSVVFTDRKTSAQESMWGLTATNLTSGQIDWTHKIHFAESGFSYRELPIQVSADSKTLYRSIYVPEDPKDKKNRPRLFIWKVDAATGKEHSSREIEFDQAQGEITKVFLSRQKRELKFIFGGQRKSEVVSMAPELQLYIVNADSLECTTQAFEGTSNWRVESVKKLPGSTQLAVTIFQYGEEPYDRRVYIIEN